MNNSRSFLLTFVLLAIAPLLAASAPSVTIHRIPNNGLQPRVEVGQDGMVHLVYFRGEPAHGNLFYAKRRPGESSFGQPIRVNSRDDSAVAAGTIRGAHLALGKNNRPHVAWMGSRVTARKSPKSKHPLSPMLYTRMNDAGNAFEPERNLVTYAWGLDGGGTVAADAQGHVYVFWHADPSLKPMNEAGRSVFMARSTDDGATFGREADVVKGSYGACGCCGMAARVDSRGRVWALYRTASKGQRDMNVLFAQTGGTSFENRTINRWNLQACPMSSSTFAESPAGMLLATERAGKLLINSANPLTGRLTDTINLALGRRAKHPALAVNSQGELLVAWLEGAGFNSGGVLHYRRFDRSGKPQGDVQRVGKAPRFSFATAFVSEADNFEILY